ncbi:luciferin 4-monooxygenase-like, partial [Photinus pyralis]
MRDTLVIPDPRGIGYEYFNAMIKYRERVAQVDGRTGEEETYDSLLKRSIRTAITMKSKGVRPGDFVSRCTLNELDACVIYIATLFVGAITANVHVTMSAQEILCLLKQVSPKIVFVAQQCEALMEKVTRELERQPLLVVLRQTQTNTPFAKFLESCENEDAFRPREAHNMDETVFVAFTSGTTGKPKGICHSHSSMAERFDKEQKCQIVATFYPPTLTLFNRFIHYTILNGFKRLVFDRFDSENPWRILNY